MAESPQKSSEQPSPGKSSGRPRSALAHRAMLKAALELLGEVGFERMSMDAVSARAGVGKNTIYRRYSGKAELVADAIESIRREITIPDEGSLQADLDALIEEAAQLSLTPVGRQSVAMIISSAAANSEFAQIYAAKYLQPRRETFRLVIERAKLRNEVRDELEADLFFDVMSGFMLYALLFPPADESWQAYVSRGLEAWLIGQGMT